MSEYRKPRNRLFVDEITSVGAVTDGDNPEGEIVFWKATQSERASAILEALLDRERRQRAAKQGVPLARISRGRVLDDLVRDKGSAAAAAYAALLSSKDEGDIQLLKSLNDERATIRVAKEQLQRFRQKKAEEPMSEETVKEAIDAVVKRWVFSQSMSRFGQKGQRGITEEMIRAELWKSEPGGALVGLLRSEYANEPLAKVKSEIRKSGQHAEGLRLLDEGIPS